MNTLIEQTESWLTQLIDKRVSEQLEDSVLLDTVVKAQVRELPDGGRYVHVDDVRKIVDEQISQINNMQLLADASKQRIQEVVIECLDTYNFDDHINDVLYTKQYQDADEVANAIDEYFNERTNLTGLVSQLLDKDAILRDEIRYMIDDKLLNQPFKLKLASVE